MLSTDDFKYYVFFVGHFTKYIWFYTLKKSDVHDVIVHSESLVGNYFNINNNVTLF